MDTSETFIKMCEKAEEIQESHDYIKGDYMVGDFELAIKLIDNPCVVFVTNPMTHTKATIWLPRQDQLQEMVGEEYAINLLYQFHQYYNTKYREIPGNWSVEQLWLAFVMKEKYNKIWVDGNWVKQKVEAVK